MQFTNAQRPSTYDGDYHGLGVLPYMDPARAETTLEFDIGLGELVDAEGYTTCLTEVAETPPFTEDEAGIGFDNANIRWVRTRVWRRPVADGGGDKEWWTAVSKTLPAGYTAVGRCNLVYIFGDFLGDNPMNGFSWNHRTPTSGYLLDVGTAEGLARSQWAPMNLNDQVVPADIGDVYTGQWAYYSNPPNVFPDDVVWIVAAIATNHVGFRGGKMVFTLGPGYAGMVPVSGSATLEIIAVSVLDTWDPSNESATSGVVQVLESHVLSWSFATFLDPPAVINITLGDLRPTGVGVPFNLYIRYAVLTAPVYVSSHVFQLSPRTDIPLPYFASQRNRVAPGGIVQPP